MSRSIDHPDAWLARLTDTQREQVLLRARLVEWWREARQMGALIGRREPEVTAAFLLFCSALGHEFSRASLYSWDRAYRADGYRGLIDQRATRLLMESIDFSAFYAEFRRVYLLPKMLPADSCHYLAAEKAKEFGWPVPTLREARRYLKAHILPDLTRERGKA